MNERNEDDDSDEDGIHVENVHDDRNDDIQRAFIQAEEYDSESDIEANQDIDIHEESEQIISRVSGRRIKAVIRLDLYYL